MASWFTALSVEMEKSETAIKIVQFGGIFFNESEIAIKSET